MLKVFLIIGLFFFFLTIRQKKIIWPLVWNYVIFSFLSFPAVAYYLLLIRHDELTLWRTLQNINPTTPIYLTIISFGGLFIFAILGIYTLVKDRRIMENKYLFLVVWAVLQFILLYAPVNYQRRLVLGIHFPLAVLSLIFFFFISQSYWHLIKKYFVAIFIVGFLLFLPSNIFVLSADIMVYQQGREFSYLEKDVYNAFLWLKENTDENSIIFSEARTGNIIPAYSLRTCYVGHPVESPFYRQRKIEPDWFFRKNRSQEIEIDFLKKRKINYIFYGPREKELGEYNPLDKSYLSKVYSSENAAVYKVNIP